MYQIRLVFNAKIIANVYSYILTRQTDNLNKQTKIVCSNIYLLSIHIILCRTPAPMGARGVIASAK